MGFNYDVKKKEIEGNAIIVTRLMNHILSETGLYLAYDKDTQEILYVDRETFKANCPLTARVPIGAFNSEVGESLEELKERVKEQEQIMSKFKNMDTSGMHLEENNNENV